MGKDAKTTFEISSPPSVRLRDLSIFHVLISDYLGCSCFHVDVGPRKSGRSSFSPTNISSPTISRSITGPPPPGRPT